MASLAAVRDAIKATLSSALGAGIEVYDTVPAKPVLPCVAIVPSVANFDAAMGRGLDTWTFELHVLVPSADERVGQDLLDPYVAGAGSSSIRQAIFNARGLGLSDVDAHVSGLASYGGSFEAVAAAHVGATLTLTVHTLGTA